MKLYLKFLKILLESVEYICIMKASREKGEMKMKIGEFVFAEYDNGEIVNGEVINVRMFGTVEECRGSLLIHSRVS